MDEEKAGEANTGKAFPERGQEIDVRPDPAGVHADDETRALRVPPRWPDANTTGAFVSRAASLRHEVRPYRWWEPFMGLWILLWIALVGVPLAGAVWAILVIIQRTQSGR